MHHAVRITPLLVALLLPACGGSTLPPVARSQVAARGADDAARARKSHDHDLEAIDARLRAATTPEERADLLSRRAELCRARKDAIDVQMYALGEALADAAEEDRASLDKRLAALEDEARALTKQAIDAYTRLVDDPALATFPGRERALGTLARLLREQGDSAAAARRYEELTTAYPASEQAADALLSLAEIAFADQHLDDAVGYADRAAAARPSDADLVSSARYIESWSLRGLAEHGRAGAMGAAMIALRDVVALGPSTRRGARFLAPSAERELVELYATYGDPREAPQFFGVLAQPASQRLLSALRARLARGSAPVQTSLSL